MGRSLQGFRCRLREVGVGGVIDNGRAQATEEPRGTNQQ